MFTPRGRLAQLVEQPVYTGKVRGSSPLSPTENKIKTHLIKMLRCGHDLVGFFPPFFIVEKEQGSKLFFGEANSVENFLKFGFSTKLFELLQNLCFISHFNVSL